MLHLEGMGYLYKYGIHERTTGDGSISFVATYVSFHRSNKTGKNSMEFHNIYMPVEDEYIKLFEGSVSVVELRAQNKNLKFLTACRASSLVGACGRGFCTSYAGKGSTMTFVENPEDVFVINVGDEWWDCYMEDSLNGFIKDGKEIFKNEPPDWARRGRSYINEEDL